MVDKEKVTEVLNEIRQGLQSHGGDLTLVDVSDEGVVKVVLEGACRGCPHAQQTIKRGVEAHLQAEVPEVKEVVAVEPEE